MTLEQGNKENIDLFKRLVTFYATLNAVPIYENEKGLYPKHLTKYILDVDIRSVDGKQIRNTLTTLNKYQDNLIGINVYHLRSQTWRAELYYDINIKRF